MMCLNAQPVSAKKSNKVYYVVIGSYSDLNNAIQEAKSWTSKQPRFIKLPSKARSTFGCAYQALTQTLKIMMRSYQNNQLNKYE